MWGEGGRRESGSGWGSEGPWVEWTREQVGLASGTSAPDLVSLTWSAWISANDFAGADLSSPGGEAAHNTG